MRRGIVVLAAGLSRRMGGPNKLLQPFRNKPLARWAIECAHAAVVDRRVLVLGRDRDEIAALAPAELYCRDNPAPDDGLASSLRIGLAALGKIDAAAVLLADMPDITPSLIDALFDALGVAYACVPRRGDTWGNPVVLSARACADAQALKGDHGARHLLKANAANVATVQTDDAAIFRDLDTAEDFMR